MRKKSKLDYMLAVGKLLAEWEANGGPAGKATLCLVGPPTKGEPRVAKIMPVFDSITGKLIADELCVMIGTEKPVIVKRQFAIEALYRGGFTTRLDEFIPRRKR